MKSSDNRPVQVKMSFNTTFEKTEKTATGGTTKVQKQRNIVYECFGFVPESGDGEPIINEDQYKGGSGSD